MCICIYIERHTILFLYLLLHFNNWLNINLQVKKDEDFCKLKVSSKDEDFKPAKKIRILLNIFHTEVNTLPV